MDVAWYFLTNLKSQNTKKSCSSLHKAKQSKKKSVNSRIGPSIIKDYHNPYNIFVFCFFGKEFNPREEKRFLAFTEQGHICLFIKSYFRTEK